MIEKEVEITVVGETANIAKVKEIRNNAETNGKELHIFDLYKRTESTNEDGETVYNDTLLAANRYFRPADTVFTFTDVETDVLTDAVADKIDGYYVDDLDELYAIYDTVEEALIAGYHDMLKEDKLKALKEELNLA